MTAWTPNSELLVTPIPTVNEFSYLPVAADDGGDLFNGGTYSSGPTGGGVYSRPQISHSYSVSSGFWENTSPIALRGTHGVRVRVISALKSRLMQAGQMGVDNWPWQAEFDLNPESPPMAYLKRGAKYYIWIGQGTRSTFRFKSFGPQDGHFDVPTP